MFYRIFAGAALLLSLAGQSLEAQTLTYSADEVRQIHDSVKLSRWDAGGRISQYCFRYMSEFFPVAQISKSRNPYSFSVNPKKSIQGISTGSGKTALPLDDYLRKLHLSGFIVVEKGVIVYEKYFSMLPGDQHTLQSVSKVVTSLLVTSFANENRIALADPIEKFIPELAGSAWQGITVKQILDMRSGMDIRSVDYSTGPFSNPKHKNYQLESALGLLPAASTTPASVYDFIIAMKPDTVAGSDAAYSNINTFVLGWMLEKLSGRKYADLVAERLWQPMGAGSDAYVCVSGQGVPWTHGGISVTLRDLARFGMMFTNSEIKKRKESLISFKQLREIFDAPVVKNPMAPFKWAYQWDLAEDGVMMKGGFGGQALYIHPEKEIVIACFNYVDEDWSIDNTISQTVLFNIIKAAAQK